MIAVFRTRTFHVVALVATLALAAMNGCRYERAETQPARVETYGAQNASCEEWSDGCQVCRRGDRDAAAACSLPGIACTRGPITCTASQP